MPTTRSRKRPSEALASLPEPAKKQRKKRTFTIPRNIPISPDRDENDLLSKKDIPVDNVVEPTKLPSPPPVLVPQYTDTSVQTIENLYVLTQTELDAMIDEAIERKIPSNKRARDDDHETDTPTSKRVNLTPAPSSGYGFLFSRPPNTAPAKSALVPSLTPTRIVRGPISSRNATPSNRHRRAPLHGSVGRKQTVRPQPAELKPVDLAPPRSRSAPDQNRGTHNIKTEAGSQVNTPKSQPAQRSLFGSLRGLAQSGFEFALNLSPRRNPSTNTQAVQTETPVNSFSPDRSPTESDGEREEEVEREEPATASKPAETNSPNSHSPRQALPFAQRPSSKYDHLHYIKPGSEEERRLAAGEWVPPPRAPTPPDEFEVAKKRNPEMPDWMIKNLLAKRAKRNTMQEEASGPASAPPKIAPLFGPDSHYARGTVDPRFVSPKAYRMHAKYPNLMGGSIGSKRSFDVFRADQKPTDSHQQPTVEDVNEQGAETEDDHDETTGFDTPLAKKQKTIFPTTPRSALKKQNDFNGSIGRSGRSVNFNANPVSGSRGLRAHYGPAGQYKGSTFADLSSPTSQDESSLSTFGQDDVLSPSTKLNTIANIKATRLEAMAALEKNLGADVPDIDFTLRDPHDPEWRPSLSNPRPGSFRVPDIDEDSMSDEEGTEPVVSGNVPPQPSTPRMSHAELPPTSTTQTTSETTFNESSIQFESTELAIEKARSRAQKYKPKDSSRLSEVSLSHSRSPSPDSDETPRPTRSSAPAVQPVGAPLQPYIEAPLDKVKRGEDGMTDHEREHQHDDWAASLQWGEPQTYEDAGTGTKEIHDLIRKNWTADDSRRSEEFWQREFDDIDLLLKKAKANGQCLRLITGMEDADQYMTQVV